MKTLFSIAAVVSLSVHALDKLAPVGLVRDGQLVATFDRIPEHFENTRHVCNMTPEELTGMGWVNLDSVTNVTPATVMTNLPSNYEAGLAIVPAYLTACSNLGVYGMNPLEARAALKERASAETNLSTRISLVEAATDLFFLREAVAKLGIDPDAAAESCDPIVTTNAAQTNVVFRLRSP